jgi:hypothetical protein
LEILEQNRLDGNKYLIGRIEKMKHALREISKIEWPQGYTYCITAANDMIAIAMKALEEK